MTELYAVQWMEVESYASRPDGFSLHTSLEEAASYIRSKMEKLPPKKPEQYWEPAGTLCLKEAFAWAVELPSEHALVKRLGDSLTITVSGAPKNLRIVDLSPTAGSRESAIEFDWRTLGLVPA